MTKKIGGTFAAELRAAGILPLALAWQENGDLSFGELVTEDQKAAVLAVYDAHDPLAGVEDAKRKDAESAVQKKLDLEAQKKGYDDIKSASGYASLPSGAPFQAEGAAFLLWRAQCWAKCYEILGSVKAGTRAEPTVAELIAEMPALVLP